MEHNEYWIVSFGTEISVRMKITVNFTGGKGGRGLISRKRELVLVFSLLGGDSFWTIDERRAVGGISWLINCS